MKRTRVSAIIAARLQKKSREGFALKPPSPPASRTRTPPSDLSVFNPLGGCVLMSCRFPVIIMSPLLEKFEAPEGGYKFINGRGEEQDADEYIRVQELKLAEEANERMKQQEQNPLFGPRSPSPVDEDSS